MTSQGSAYSQFKRALQRRNFMLAWTMAAELPKVPLWRTLAGLHSLLRWTSFDSAAGGATDPRLAVALGQEERS